MRKLYPINLEKQLQIQKCPHCNVDKPSMVAFSQGPTSNYSGTDSRFWRTYYCKRCGGVVTAASRKDGGIIFEMYPSGGKETFDFARLPKEVAEDFREALACYSIFCFNAFAAMTRRTVQSMCTDLGAEGKNKVLKQLKDAKAMAEGEIDEDTFEVLQQIIIAGHNGAHPHLPKLSPERAAILLELMKSVLDQIYVRKEKLKEAIALRKEDIAQSKPNSQNSS